jgi:hypothetical protein
MRSDFFKTWAQISMGLLFALLVLFGFYILTR